MFISVPKLNKAHKKVSERGLYKGVNEQWMGSSRYIVKEQHRCWERTLKIEKLRWNNWIFLLDILFEQQKGKEYFLNFFKPRQIHNTCVETQKVRVRHRWLDKYKSNLHAWLVPNFWEEWSTFESWHRWFLGLAVNFVNFC